MRPLGKNCLITKGITTHRVRITERVALESIFSMLTGNGEWVVRNLYIVTITFQKSHCIYLFLEHFVCFCSAPCFKKQTVKTLCI